jgi:hypothetical protein
MLIAFTNLVPVSSYGADGKNVPRPHTEVTAQRRETSERRPTSKQCVGLLRLLAMQAKPRMKQSSRTAQLFHIWNVCAVFFC